MHRQLINHPQLITNDSADDRGQRRDVEIDPDFQAVVFVVEHVFADVRVAEIWENSPRRCLEAGFVFSPKFPRIERRLSLFNPLSATQPPFTVEY